jgi:hypothetical protein
VVFLRTFDISFHLSKLRVMKKVLFSAFAVVALAFAMNAQTTPAAAAPAATAVKAAVKDGAAHAEKAAKHHGKKHGKHHKKG